MQTASAALITASTTWPRSPRFKIEIRWDGTNWVDETSYLLEMSGTSEGGAVAPGPSAMGTTVADKLTIKLDNHTKRFSQGNAAGALYAYISANGGYGAAVRASVGMVVAGGATEYIQVFTGHLRQPRETIEPPEVLYQALDMGARAAGHRISTILQVDRRADQYVTDLALLLDPVPTVLADTGVDVYPFLWADDESVWEEMVRVAEAEGGRIWFDGLGQLHFWNYLHLAGMATAATYLATSTHFTKLLPDLDYANIWNRFVIPYRPRFMAGLQVVWQASQAIAVPPNSTRILTAQFQQPVYYVYADGAYAEPRLESGVDFTARTSSYIDKTASCLVTVPNTDHYAQRVNIHLINTTAHQVYFDNVQVRGWPILVSEERSAEDESAVSIAAYDERTNDRIDNVYVQSEEAAQSLASSLTYRYKNPRLTVRLRGAWGHPYLEVGDKVHVDDSGATGVHTDFYVGAIDWRCDRWTYTHDLTLMEAAGIYANSDYFVVGTTALGAVGRAFY